MSCSSPHPPSEASDRAAAAQAQAYHKHKQKDGSSSHTGSNAHLITQRLIKLASKNAGSGSGSGSQAALHDKQASAGSSSQSQSQSLTQSLTLPHHQQSSNGAANGTGTGTRAIPLSHPALSHSSAQQAFQSHTQPTVRPQSAQAPSQPDPQPPTQQQPTHPLRSSNSYQTLGPMVYVCCATSRIGIATIRGLRMNYPGIKIRAGVGMYENKSEVHRMFRDAHLDEIDCVQVDPRKRQSLIWALVGVQALLVIPDAETNVRTALAHVQAAKTAGVALVTVVTKPKPPDKANTNTNSNTNTNTNTNSIDPKKAAPTESTPHVVERYTLKTKLGCCFMRLPLDLVDDIVCPPPPAGSVTVSSPSDGVLAGAPKFHLSDVGTACATILANHQQHVFTRYDLEVADADNKRKYQESLEQQQLQLQQQLLLQQQQQQLLRHGSGAGTPTQIGGMDDHDSSQPSTPDSCNRGGTKSRRGSTASTITDVSDRSNSSTPEHSRTHCRHVNPSHHHHHHHHHYEQHHRSRSNSSDEHSPHHHSPGRVH